MTIYGRARPNAPDATGAAHFCQHRTAIRLDTNNGVAIIVRAPVRVVAGARIIDGRPFAGGPFGRGFTRSRQLGQSFQIGQPTNQIYIRIRYTASGSEGKRAAVETADQ